MSDDDDDLEIIFGGYSSPGKLFAINPDGSNVPGFPYSLGETACNDPFVAFRNDTWGPLTKTSAFDYKKDHALSQL